jgi:hypothetical protein
VAEQRLCIGEFERENMKYDEHIRLREAKITGYGFASD